MVSEEFELRALDRARFEARHGKKILELLENGVNVPESLLNEKEMDIALEMQIKRERRR